MCRDRRQIVSNSCYEICFRARESLPLSAHRSIKKLIKSYLARTQRDDKVTLCHDLWNGSHPHLIVLAHDSQQCVNFYAELQKKLTDAFKRLLGKRHLNIWEGRVTVTYLPDLEAVKNAIIYLYANPAQDDLEDTIEKYPGLSSWSEFQRCPHQINAWTEETVPWIRQPSIPVLTSPYLSADEDRNLTNLLTTRNKRKTHKLYRSPNAWMKCFEVESEEEVKEINENIVQGVRDREFAQRERRRVEKKPVMGQARLMAQPIMKAHEPKKHERKIFVRTKIRALRIEIIRLKRLFDTECRRCYESWKRGDFSVKWPPGAFRPPLPPAYNVLPDWPGSNLLITA